ncbi:serine--tRNA ligase [bacterium]|nr:serine--tRNA ligase [bacterium]
MHDIRALRDDPHAFQTALARRSGGVHLKDGRPVVEVILELDAGARAAVTQKQAAEQARNATSKEIGKAKAAKDEARAAQLMAEVADAKAAIERAGAAEEMYLRERDDLLASLPNLPAADAPEGADETANRDVRRWGAPRAFNFQPKDHADLGEALGMMDFEAAARMSGARFVVLKGQLARLERALAAFMLDVQTGEHGYVEHSPPLIVREQAMFGTGQLPKFLNDQFYVNRYLETGEEAPAVERFDDGEERPVGLRRWLIPTAEVSLTNLVREQVLEASALPMRMTAATPCFRAEAGSAGRDTKGMIRQHQFTKVELVSITRPEDSDAEHERMTACAEEILKRLELPYRVMLLSTGDMGFSARKTYDLDVWLPSQNTYREISSCSNCGDFQARRMDARYRPEAGAKPEFVHTLNGSGLAVGRTLVAVLENHQEADGRVRVPAALVPYMGGVELIG